MSSDANDPGEAGEEEILEQMDQVREEMDQVRDKLDGDIDRLNVDMRNVFDWQAYVRSAPLTSAGIAFAVGYLFAPAIRSRPVPQVAAVNPASSGGGIFGTLATLAVSAAVRFAAGYVTEMMTSTAAPNPQRDVPDDYPGSPVDQTLDLGP
ncbi:MAG: hypothetical protein JWM11_7655 [Planctomycetaceae bacterium]|nr:hypothetical protein [Planctomycetaceae bacterium]